MTEPVKFRVLDHIRSTLAAVAGGGDYNFALNRDGQVTAYGSHPGEFHTFPAIVVHETDDQPEEQDAGYEERRMQVELICATREPDRRYVQRSIERLTADVTRALHADHQRGGTAIDTRVEAASTAFDDSQFPVVLFLLKVTVLYRHGYKDPTSLAPSF